MVPDIARVADIVREVAASEIMPRFRHLEDRDVREKGPGDLVTIADVAAERQLSVRLTELLPGSVAIGEEAATADERVLERIQGDDPVWIIDPVDGTANFVAGRPVFAVMVALARRGETLAGWIHDPCGGSMAVATRGGGAWLDGVRLCVAPPVPLETMTGAVGTRYFERRVREHLESRMPRLAGTFTLQCAGHEYLRLLRGESHFSLYRRIMPWDHAAGALMHAEAGGYAAKLDGIGYTPMELAGGLLLAPDRPSWNALRTLLFGD
ncbi:inositol monophosphatase family protein [Rhodospirillum centenum]|uniref:Inositol-1-monophosphatase, putative n=1 Tax=Rhodospirillum centenum (strain ATCC 51521 / SW) TaxID=414684 RepID=B6IQ51_RHOCS|nr:inositol monophosphatase family protein [Rhodospirillum centenum]ACI97587.1 inositol-1-monophosphatase, putative [Rhodospirillum centenum SW]